MDKDILNTIILGAAFLALFASAELLYHYAKLKAEVTRKVVHIGTGLLTMLFPIMLDNHWLVLLLCASFALILLTSLKFKLLPSINAIDRKSHGSISYPIAVYLCYLVFSFFEESDTFSKPYFWFYIPILTMAICDPMAALIGKNFPWGRYRIGKDGKTLSGSFAFFLSSCLLSYILLSTLNTHGDVTNILAASIYIGVATAITEAISVKGLDNITIPFVAVLMLFLITLNII